MVMEDKITIQLDGDFKKKLLPMQLIGLLPPKAAKFFYMVYVLSKNNKKCFYSQNLLKLCHMSKDDCDIALQTLIDNGIVNVIKNGGSYQCLINYDKFEEFSYPFNDLADKDEIKLSTEVTFRNITDDSCLIDELTDDQMKDITIDQFKKFQERFYSIQKKKSNNDIDSLFDAAKERHRKVREEMARECFLLSKKDVGNVSE